MSKQLAIKSNSILTDTGMRAGYVLIERYKIVDVLSQLPTDFAGIVEDVGDLVLMPGGIDCHVHINEPGRTEWEGFATATKAAAAGGMCSLIEMPLNASPVTTNVANFNEKLDAACNKLAVNCGFWGGVVPDNANELDALLKRGAFGLKAFLTHSGIDEFPNTTANELRFALSILKKHNKPLLVHCELDEPHADQHWLDENPTSYQAYLKSRPKSWENKAVQLMIDLCRESGAKVHLVHISSAEALPLIAAAKKEGLPLTAETCPHYLFFDAESIPDAATVYKCAPPIREKANNEKLWEALKDGTLDFVASDHSPAPPEIKEIETGDFKKAWGGIAGLQFTLPVFWTAARKRGFTLTQLSALLSSNVARFIGLEKSKGRIAKGYDADLVVWNPDKKFVVESTSIHHRHKISPYEGLELYGTIEQCYVNGSKVMAQGEFLNSREGSILLSK